MPLFSNNSFIIKAFLICIIFLGTYTFSQGQSINYQAQDKELSVILNEISEEYGLFFSYPSELLAGKRTSIQAKELSPEQFLKKLLSPFHLQAKKSKESYYFIQKAKRKVLLRIYDVSTREALAYATVNILQSQRGAYADGQGRAMLSFDPGKETPILIRHIGYQNRELKLSESTPDTLWVEMTLDEVALEEVVIEYTNTAITLKEASLFHLRPSEMKVLPGLPEADVLLSVQMLPGFGSNDETASGINVRGGGKDEMLVYWDRIPIYQQAHFFGTLTSFIPSTVEDITAYKNFIPTSFTGATSGLLDISLADSIPDVPQVISNSNFTHADLMLHVPIKQRISLMLGGRLSYNNQFASPTYLSHQSKLFDGSRQEDILNDLNADIREELELDINDIIDLSYNDLNAKLIADLSPKDYLSISAMYNQDIFFLNAQAEESPTLTERSHDVSFRGLNILYNRNWSDSWQSQLSFSSADYYMTNADIGEFESGEPSYQTTITNALKNTELKAALTYTGWEHATLEAGYQFNDYENFLDFLEENAFEENFQDTLESFQQAHGAYLRYHYSYSDKIDFQPQIRMDYFPSLEQTVVNPVLNIQYQALSRLWLKASYGRYAQALRSLREGDLDVTNVSESVWLLADDDDLSLLRSQQLSIGGLYSQKGWLVDLDLYWKQTDGLNALNQFQDNEEFDFAQGNSQAIGMDLMIKKSFGSYQSWLSYSLSHVENTFEELQNDAFPSSFDRPHQFRWVHNVYKGPFEFSLGWTLKTGTPYTPPQGIQEIMEPNGDVFHEIIYQDINNDRLPYYHRMDLSVWYKFNNPTGAFNGLIGFSIQNLYNRENVWKRFYYLEDVNGDDQPEIVEEERYFLGFTPNLSLKLSFN